MAMNPYKRDYTEFMTPREVFRHLMKNLEGMHKHIGRASIGGDDSYSPRYSQSTPYAQNLSENSRARIADKPQLSIDSIVGPANGAKGKKQEFKYADRKGMYEIYQQIGYEAKTALKKVYAEAAEFFKKLRPNWYRKDAPQQTDNKKGTYEVDFAADNPQVASISMYRDRRQAYKSQMPRPYNRTNQSSTRQNSNDEDLGSLVNQLLAA